MSLSDWIILGAAGLFIKNEREKNIEANEKIKPILAAYSFRKRALRTQTVPSRISIACASFLYVG